MSLAPGLRLRLVRAGMRVLAKPLFARVRSVPAARIGLVATSLAVPLPWGVRAARQPCGGIDGLRLRPPGDAAGPVLLWFHGGAYVTGSAFTHRGLLGRIARAAGCSVVAPDYRLAPEHPAPAAFEDALRAFDGLVAEGVPPVRIAIGGDSAGGGLALALLAAVAARGLQPAACVLLSPWADLTLSGGSIRANAARDPLLPAGRMAEVVAMIRGDLSPADPRLSPVLGALPGVCPVLIHVGSTEVLLDDSRRTAAGLRRAGAAVTLFIRPGAPHVLAWLAPWVPEATDEIRRIGAFLRDLQPGAPTVSR
ncbi:MAG: alpha/beta hydrolase fold domain-containing protein [Rhodobacteraceae bacterium]|nr:alpha/beta hydrolase fold domain-containing protein [Paracoccaceae bacterium]